MRRVADRFESLSCSCSLAWSCSQPLLGSLAIRPYGTPFCKVWWAIQISKSPRAVRAFGWFSPLTIDDFTLNSVNGDVNISVQRIRTQKSWLRLWLSSPNIGNIELESPRIEVMVDEEDSQEEIESTDDAGGSRRWPTISATITDGALLVREKQRERPVINVDQVDIALHIEQQPSGSMLVVDPIALQRGDSHSRSM